MFLTKKLKINLWNTDGGSQVLKMGPLSLNGATEVPNIGVFENIDFNLVFWKLKIEEYHNQEV